MKLQIEPTLIRTIRESDPHRIPKNLFLKILLFIAVYFIVTIVEYVFMLGFMILIVFPRYNEAVANGTQTSDTLGRLVNDAFMDPKYIPVTLFCTGFGTILILLWCRFAEGRKLRTMGFTKERAFTQYLIGLAIGFLSFSAVVGISALFGGVAFSGFKGQFTPALLLTLVGYIIQGMSEEVVCRGYVMTSTLRHHNTWWAIGISAVLFSLWHGMNNGVSLLALANIVLCGVMFSLYVLRTNSIWGACAFHSIWNFVQGNFYGLPVSGNESGDTIFSFSFKGSELVNGGAFGLEAGIATTIVLAVWIVCLLFVPNPFAKKTDTPAPQEA